MTKTHAKLQYSARIKAWRESTPKVTQGMHLSSDTKAEAVRIAVLGKSVGITQELTCKRLGISKNTIWNWSKLSRNHPAATVVAVPVPAPPTKRAKMVPFTLAESTPRPTIELTLPSGAKASGLTVAQATELLKALA